jgi:ribosomal protein S5
VNGRGAGPEEKTYLARFASVISAFTKQSPAPFAATVRAAFGRAEASEVRIYSLLPEGDKSHLIQLAREAKVRGMRVVLKAPAGAGIIPGIDAVEVL